MDSPNALARVAHHEGDRLGRLGLDGGVDDVLDLLAEGVLLDVLLDAHAVGGFRSKGGGEVPGAGGVTETECSRSRSLKQRASGEHGSEEHPRICPGS